MSDILDIRIGTLVKGNHQELPQYLESILPYGFESISITFWQTLGDVNLQNLADSIRPILDRHQCVVSSLSVFGNPLESDEAAALSRQAWEQLITHAGAFGCSLITGFSGRVRGAPVPESLPRLAEVFTPLLDAADANGTRIAFENCPMGGDWKHGDWNIAFSPAAWELIFTTLAYDNLGLQWEPAHQLMQLADPMPQLDDWHQRIFSVHGKDASVWPDRLARHGQLGPHAWGAHRHPGFGDSNWTEIISRLRGHGFSGFIEIEGWHDPVYQGDIEIPGQVAALRYLQNCRGPILAEQPVVR